MDTEPANYLELADWRRRIAALYAEVRALAAEDPAGALAHWRAVREQLYRAHPQSPVPATQRATFAARHFPHDPALRFEVKVVREAAGGAASSVPDQGEASALSGAASGLILPESLPVAIPTSAAGAMAFRRIGWVDVPFLDGERRLTLFWLQDYGGGLFLPFRDTTNGVETYGAGRYLLDGAKSADLGGDPARGTLILDFNFAYHPSCAFDPRWACPLAPPENRLDLPIRAGERLA